LHSKRYLPFVGNVGFYVGGEGFRENYKQP
jgi:hypothetical protein